MRATIPEQIAALRDMGTKDLQAEHERLLGTPTRSFNTGWLRQRLARALAERAPEPTSPEVQRAVRVATGPPPKPRPHDPRIPPVGSVIRRQYQGREIAVTVRRTGFKYEGRLYRSLSAIARQVTGARWSGPLFFGLAPRNRERRTG